MESKFKINDIVNKKSGKPFKNGSNTQRIVGFGINEQDPKKRPCAMFDDGSNCNLDMLSEVIYTEISSSFLNRVMSGEHDRGELSMILGQCKPSTELMRFKPVDNKQGEYEVIIEDVGKKFDNISVKQSFDIIKSMVDLLKKDSTGKIIPSIVTKYEKIGDSVYPVNYHENGMVTLDYPLKFEL
jgi:hypothetical protein